MVHQIFVTTSWDDGHVLDHKLASVLKKYGIMGTFYVAPHNGEYGPEKRLSDDAVRALAQDFEIGAHTFTHRHLPTLSLDEARREIAGSKEALEKVIGRPVVSFCYPAGKYTKAHPPLVREAGFACARTVERFKTDAGSSPWEMPTTIHTYDHWLDIGGLLTFVRFNPLMFARLYRRWDAQAIALFDQVYREGGVFHLWGHSWEIEAHGDWERLERVLRHIGGHADVRYVTNGELAKLSGVRCQLSGV